MDTLLSGVLKEQLEKVQNKSKSGTHLFSEADREGVFGLYMTPSDISVSEGSTSDEWEMIAYGNNASNDDGLTAVKMIVTLPHQAEVGSHPLPSDDYDLVFNGLGFAELPNSPAKKGIVEIERYRGGRKYAMFSADATYKDSSNTEGLDINATYRHSVDTFADIRAKEFALLSVTATGRKVGAVMSDSGQYVVDVKFDEAGGMLPVAVEVSFPNTLLHERKHALPHDEIKLNFIVKGVPWEMATEGSFFYSTRYGYLYVGVTLRFLPKEGESLAAGEIKVGMTSEWPRAG